MNWSTRRQILYGTAAILFLTAVIVYSLRDVIFPSPTCFDRKKNGFELDVDCGGTCSLRCSQEVKPLKVLWSRVIKSSRGTYDFVGMVENKNINNAARNIGYQFVARDRSGNVIGEYNGTTTEPVDGDFPLMILNIPLIIEPDAVDLLLSDGSHFAVNENPADPMLRITDRTYEPGKVPRVYATIKNTKRTILRNVSVRAVLFDANNNPYAVGDTIIPFIDKESMNTVSYTWNAPLPVPPAKIGIYPILDPFAEK